MAYGIIAMHVIAEIPEAVPLPLLNLILIKGNDAIQPILQLRFHWIAAILQAPVAKSP
ncbi:hypothetical protein D3C71_1961370 [compost metagenome]